ncbi:unnamed protein product [Allacma fusca]|uniref:FHA domain-containing protein n=1 Tax=Allacma fusca TaxID=39272 RepID=A0A8J2JRJ5_9HEXA|nr:unnamed protein product [Allacma fusca]
MEDQDLNWSRGKMWKLKRQTVNEDFETPEVEGLEGNKILLVRVKGKESHAYVVCNSPVVSRNHCQLEFRNGDWFVSDLGSMNGTYINGEKIEPSDPKNNCYKYDKIVNGDTLGLGIDSVPSEDQNDEVRTQADFFVFKFSKLKGNHQEVTEERTIDIVTISDSDEDVNDQSEVKKTDFTHTDSDSDVDIILEAPEEVQKDVQTPLIKKVSPVPVISPHKDSSSSNLASSKRFPDNPSRPGPASWKKKLRPNKENTPEVPSTSDFGTAKRKQGETPERDQKRLRSLNSEGQSSSEEIERERTVKESKVKAMSKLNRKSFVIYSSDDESSSDDIVRSCRQGSLDSVRMNPQLNDDVLIPLGRAVFIDNGKVCWDEAEIPKLELSMKNIKRIEKQLLYRRFGSMHLKCPENTAKNNLRDKPDRNFGFTRNISYEPSPDPLQEAQDKYDDLENILDDAPMDSNSPSPDAYSEEELPQDIEMSDREDDVWKAAIPVKPKFVQSILIAPSPMDPLNRRRYRGKKPSVSFSSPRKKSNATDIKLKLRRIAEDKNKKKELEKTVAVEATRPEHHQAPKVKCTAMSRGAKLADDLISNNKAEPQKTPLVLPKPNWTEAIAAMQIPENKTTNQTKNFPQNKIHQNSIVQNVLQKASSIQPSSAANSRGTSTVTLEKVRSEILDRSNRLTDKIIVNKPPIHFDQPYKDILVWNPKWLEEQKTCKSTPPDLLGNRPLCGTLDEYVNYGDYVEIFYPLLLVEFWRCLWADYAGGRMNRRHVGPHGKPPSCEFPVGIESVLPEAQCPLTSNYPPMDSRNQLPQPNRISSRDSDYGWSKVFCHGYSKDRNLLNRNLDFGIVTLHFNMPHQIENAARVNRKCFAFIENGESNAIEGKTSVHKGLYDHLMRGKEPPQFKTSYMLIVKMSPEERERLAVEIPAELKKISYVAPKRREFQYILTLHESPLFEKVLTPSLEYPKFDIRNCTTPQAAALVSSLSKLNSLQKSVVYSASSRILKDTEPEVMLLHGPPGTGKTHVITGLIVQLLKGHYKSSPVRLLVCTPSNTAINEIIQRVEDFLRENHAGEPVPVMTRIGSDEFSKSKFSLDKMAEERCKQPTAVQSISKQIKDLTQQIKNLETLMEEKITKKEDTTALEMELRGCRKRCESHKADLQKIMEETRNSRPQRREVEIERKKILLEASVIFSTLGSCAGSMMQRNFGRMKRPSTEKPKITACIIDEATQATEPESLSPLMLDVSKLFLVGDPMQLPATIISQEAAEKYLGNSLFNRHYNFYKKRFPNGPSPVMHLEVQYRMHPSIIDWPNKVFYDGKLITLNTVGRARVNKIKLEPYVFINFDGVQSGADGKICNTDEVKLIVEILKTMRHQNNILNSQSSFPFEIGIITPYREQKRGILEAIKKKGSPDSKSLSGMKIEVDTIDSYQGREKDIIIFSCVRSNGIGFLTSQNRLCVALTRAKFSLITIGNGECLSSDSLWRKLISDAKSRGLYRNIPNNYCVARECRSIIERAILVQEVGSEIPTPRGWMDMT